MKTHTFLELLQNHKEKSLLFEYRDGNFVGANYHITEVKNIAIEAVDCGARSDSWKETVIQLWESPEEKDSRTYMSAFKALGILNKVARIKPLEEQAEIKFEYGNNTFHTAQLFVNDYSLNQDQIIVKLGVEKTQCKAQESCGVEVATEETAAACCSDSGCC